MKAYHLRALLIMAAAVAIIFFIVSQLDFFGLQAASQSVDELSLELENTKLLFLFSQTFEEKEFYCQLLDQRISSQMERTSQIWRSLRAAEQRIFLFSLEPVKERYFLSNAELYLYFKQANKLCEQENHLILFFYSTAHEPCPECLAQGAVLDSIREKCSNVKIFSFPADVDLEVLNLLKEMFGVSSAPSIVIDESNVYSGLMSEESILQLVECEPR